LTSLAQPKNPQELLAQLSARAPALLAMLLVVAIGVQGGLIVTGSGTHAPAGGPAAAAHPRTLTRPLDLAIIRNLFKAPPKSNGADAPETTAALVLAGVLAVDDPERGMAILGPNAASAKLYGAGADIPAGGVRLHAVYRDHVLLERNGTLETLYLPRLSSSAAPPTPTIASNVPPPGQRLQALARNNGGLLNGLIRIQPVFNGGKLSGYRLFPGTGGVPGMTRLGLKAGDLVTAVNGTPLDDPNHANDILQSLSNASSATVTISRNGVEEDVNLNLENVAAEAEAAAEAAAANAPPDNGAGPGGRFGGFGRPGPGHGPNPATNGTDASAAGDNSAAPEGPPGSAPAAPATNASQ
jgi:general secretion pathway protein C